MDDARKALDEWQDAYQMSDDQVKLTWSLFERRLADLDATIELTESQMRVLEAKAEDRNWIEQCQLAFEPLKILVLK
jgi:hypothetical protein